MLLYRATSNYVAAKNIGGGNFVEQCILDTITFYAQLHKEFTYQNIKDWIARKYKINISEEEICAYLGVYASIGILEVI